MPVVPRRISASEFHEAEGVEDWRVLSGGACTQFRTGSFSKGVELIGVIGALAEAANHHPDVDLRYGAVTVRLRTHEVDGLSERDVDLARRISAVARELGAQAAPSAVQDVQVSVGVLAPSRVLPFWRAVLGYREAPGEHLVDPGARGPSVLLQQIEAPRPGGPRVQVEVSLPHDEAEARVAAAIAAGGRLVSEAHAPAWWTLADPEGAEVGVTTWMGRE